MSHTTRAVPAAYLILQSDNKILMSIRKNTGYQDGNYQLPSGHVEGNELPITCMIREAKEEVGINIAPQGLELVHCVYRPVHDETDNRVDLFFHTTKWEGEITNKEPEKCEDWEWVKLNKLPENIMPHVKVALDGLERKTVYTELGVGWLKENGLYKL